MADVAWASTEFISQHGFENTVSVAPEMAEKRELYLAKGAKEVWFCDESGEMEFFTYEGRIMESRICTDFPPNIRE